MEQELRFGLDLGLTEEKRFEPIMSNFLGRFFQFFIGKEIKIKNIVASALNSYIK